MKRWLTVSFGLHAFLFGLLFVGRRAPALPEPGLILRVSLHAAPAPARETGPELEAVPAAALVVKPDEAEPENGRPVEKPSEPPADREERKPAPREEHVPGTATGPAVRVEGGAFPYSYYLNLIQLRIQENWSPPYRRTGGRESRTAQVGFIIHRDGRVSDVELEAGTEFYLFDQAALRAVMNAGRFPPPPGGMTQDYLKIHVTFEALP
ncbi:MAG: TonB family protein [bacterium]|nr:TonB family protein [bacterium]